MRPGGFIHTIMDVLVEERNCRGKFRLDYTRTVNGGTGLLNMQKAEVTIPGSQYM